MFPLNRWFWEEKRGILEGSFFNRKSEHLFFSRKKKHTPHLGCVFHVFFLGKSPFVHHYLGNILFTSSPHQASKSKIYQANPDIFRGLSDQTSPHTLQAP